MTESLRIPQRTCIGCRTTSGAPGMLRFIAPLGELLLEADKKTAKMAIRLAGGGRGRGAWLHFRKECVAKAVKTQSFSRAFRRAVAGVDSSTILAQMQAQAERTNNAQGDLR